MSTSDLFIITSVINTGNNKWTYTNVRSVFSTEERFHQTLQTIQSIRNLKDNTKIILVECSNLSEEMENTLKQNVDYYLQTYSIDYVREGCINSSYKGFGEVLQTIEAVKYIKENHIDFHKLFKISGRYYLNENFLKEKYLFDVYNFYMYTEKDGLTVIYSLPNKFIDNFLNTLLEIVYRYQINGEMGLETILPIMCNPKNILQLPLGVSGYVAVDVSKKLITV